LDGEERAETRREYVTGEVYAMAGAGENHNRIAGNVFFQLRSKARGGRCGVFMSDMKLRIENGERFYYPDVMLVCNENDDHSHYKDAPCLIAEVLSPSTEAVDRREKWLAYSELDSLRYYLLISADRKHVDYYQRDEEGAWQVSALSSMDTILVQCKDGTSRFSAGLCLDDIYEDVVWR
jgi:Uma2 family endonuclease